MLFHIQNKLKTIHHEQTQSVILCCFDKYNSYPSLLSALWPVRQWTRGVSDIQETPQTGQLNPEGEEEVDPNWRV